jgi:hypothetical protein
MIRADRELLAEMARVNSDVPSLALRMMEGSATAEEQRVFAARLARLGQRLQHRAEVTGAAVVDGEVVAGEVVVEKLLLGLSGEGGPARSPTGSGYRGCSR